MSGHNRWSKIKHTKAATDAKKSKGWTKLLKEVTMSAKGIGEDKLMEAALDAGAEDVRTEGDIFLVVTEPGKMHDVLGTLEKKGMKSSHSEVGMYPDTHVRLEGKDAEHMLKLVQQLEDHD